MADSFYAVTRELDPLTGDVLHAAGTSTWAAGQPMAEVLLRVLRTPRGSALRDPAYGIDTSRLDNRRPNARAECEAAIRDAIAPWVVQGFVTDVEVDVEVQDDLLVWEVRFRDARDQPGGPVRGSF